MDDDETGVDVRVGDDDGGRQERLRGNHPRDRQQPTRRSWLCLLPLPEMEGQVATLLGSSPPGLFLIVVDSNQRRMAKNSLVHLHKTLAGSYYCQVRQRHENEGLGASLLFSGEKRAPTSSITPLILSSGSIRLTTIAGLICPLQA